MFCALSKGEKVNTSSQRGAIWTTFCLQKSFNLEESKLNREDKCIEHKAGKEIITHLVELKGLKKVLEKLKVYAVPLKKNKQKSPKQAKKHLHSWDSAHTSTSSP